MTLDYSSATIQCSTSHTHMNPYTNIYFGESQLSPGSIGISPLPSSHPRIFQHSRVRTFLRLTAKFILLKGSSPGFGSFLYNEGALFKLAFTVASRHSLLTCCIRILTGSFFNRHDITLSVLRLTRLCLFVSQRFQLLFHSPQRGAFHLSLTVLVHYR